MRAATFYNQNMEHQVFRHGLSVETSHHSATKWGSSLLTCLFAAIQLSTVETEYDPTSVALSLSSQCPADGRRAVTSTAEIDEPGIYRD